MGKRGSRLRHSLALLATPSRLGSLVPILGSSEGKRLAFWAHCAETPPPTPTPGPLGWGLSGDST